MRLLLLSGQRSSGEVGVLGAAVTTSPCPENFLLIRFDTWSRLGMQACWRGSLQQPSKPQNPDWFLGAFSRSPTRWSGQASAEVLLTSRCLFPTRDNFGFITYRYTCDAFAALENGHTLRRSDEPQFELCFGGQKQFCKSHYADLGKRTPPAGSAISLPPSGGTLAEERE